MRKKKILYLHGLDGSLSREKQEALERYFQVVAPRLDYRNTPNMFKVLCDWIAFENADAVIGNSMGGCFAYYLSLEYSIPALCFNPALCLRPVQVDVPELKPGNNPIVFILGGQDDTIPAVDNFEWIRQNANRRFVLKWYNEEGHRVEMQTFRHEVELFAKSLT
jgi:esterase/lipase